MIVCWGGYFINENEYFYVCCVGMQLGLWELNICIGCGSGVMEVLMKGVVVGYVQQCYKDSCFIGMIELFIIVVELLNLLVNELIIMLDIEKCLEVFVCIVYGIIIFLGGVGIVEELFYLLGILMYFDNKVQVLLLIFIGLKESVDYFCVLDEFIIYILGELVCCYYWIIIDDFVEVVWQMKKVMLLVKESCCEIDDVYSFNWLICILLDLQMLFDLIYENMVNFKFFLDQLVEVLVVDLCCVFFGIVVGNVKEVGIQVIEQYGFYKLYGDLEMMCCMDDLLQGFVVQYCMKFLGGIVYIFCYEIIV